MGNTNKKVVYTVLVEENKGLLPPLHKQKGWDYICFTDFAKVEAGVWTIQALPKLPVLAKAAGNPNLIAGLLKALPHRFLQQYEYSLYVEPNRLLAGRIDRFTSKKPAELQTLGSVFYGPFIAAERLMENQTLATGQQIKSFTKQQQDRMKKQMKRWQADGLPEGNGCPETGVLGRKHNLEQVSRAMEIWAVELQDGCMQDAPALAYACYKAGVGWQAALAGFPGQGEWLSPSEEFAPDLSGNLPKFYQLLEEEKLAAGEGTGKEKALNIKELDFIYEMMNRSLQNGKAEEGVKYGLMLMALSNQESGLEKYMSAVRVIMAVYWKKEAYDQLRRFIELYVNKQRVSQLDQCRIYYILCLLAGQQRQYDLSNQYADQYLLVRKKVLNSGDEALGKTVSAWGDNPVGEENYKGILYAKLINHMELGNFTAAEESIAAPKMLDVFIGNEEYAARVVQHYCKNKRFEGLGRLLAAFKREDLPIGVEKLCKVLDSQLLPEDYPAVLEVLEKQGVQDYPVLLNLREREPEDIDRETVFGLACAYVQDKVGDGGQYLWLVLLAQAYRLQLDPAPVYNMGSLEVAEFAVLYLYSSHLEWVKKLRQELEAQQQESTPLENVVEQYLLMRVSEMLCESHGDELEFSPESYLERYFHGLDKRFQWESTRYLPELLEGTGSPLLPPKVRAVCAMHQMHKLGEIGDTLGALSALRVALENNPELGDIAFALTARLTGQLEEGSRGDLTSDEEVEEILSNIKPRIEFLLAGGRIQEIIGIIHELERMMPSDPDVRRFKIMAGLLPPS